LKYDERQERVIEKDEGVAVLIEKKEEEEEEKDKKEKQQENKS
jgi:hypothetical protein